jgi:amino acid adenylation domain-containing protein
VPSAGVHRLFEAQALRTPGATAVLTGHRVVTYGDLNAQANRVAHGLLARGVAPDSLVGLLSNRSVEMVAGIFGILKAGAAYVPLNADYPPERLAFIVKDAELPLIVATPGLETMAAVFGAETIAFPSESGGESNPDVAVPAEHLAYVIYTSGSTGQPKGVGLPHAGLNALLTFTREQMEIGPGDRVLQFASFSFDASLWEILAALVSGATLVLGTSDELMPGPSLHALMKARAVTIALLSPSVLQILPPDDLDTLRIIIAGTEKLTGGIVSRWKSPARRFFNAYGPTETTIYQLIWEAPDGPPPDNPPIGTPTPGVDVYLLDENLQPVAAGASGELCIAGSYLGRGYLNRPELTREKFLSLPLEPNGGAVRVYRSGDRARRLPDGNYEYHGRMDLQVKVRGFRVEPGEVETVLEQHPGVESSAVVASADGAEQMRLWVYFIPRGAPPAGAELRAFLAERLPDYMIPSGFSVMARWPLNANGKLDRGKLPPPGQESASTRPDTRALSSAEARVLSWCREILGRRDVGPDDLLPDAGFHSLAFAQLAWRIQDELGASPSFSEMFGRPTVAELASWMQARSAQRRAPLGGVIPVDRRERLPLSSAQERVWFLERLHPGNNAYRFQSILRFYGRLNVAALERALNALVERHEILRTTFPQAGGRPFQQIHTFEPFALPVHEASAAQAEGEIDRLIREPFVLEQLPLVRWRLFRTGLEEHWLLHTEHHLLHDAWGYGVFLEELFAAYDNVAGGRPAGLLPLAAQFADLAAWQQRQLADGRWDDQLDYWEKKLRGAARPALLPSDRPRSATQTFAGAQIHHAIDRQLSLDLLAACAREHVTPYMWLHAAFQAFLFRYTGQTDIVVGSGFANRRPSEARQLLGMMINTVALRTDFSGDPTFREALVRFRRSAIEAADNQDAPYDKVVQRLGPGTVLFNTFFDSYDQPFPAYRNDSVRVESLDGINNGRCKFDLTALVIPGEDAPVLLWEYNTDLFTGQTAERMMRHFLALVTASVARPALPVSRLAMLSAGERRHLVAVGRGKEPPRTSSRIEEVFATVAAAHPHAAAVVCGDEQLSYRDLDIGAEDLAARLRADGVVAGGVVAFELPRGFEAISAMLAILKCRCAYLPLDPKLPAARRNALLGAVSPQALLTQGAVARLAAPPSRDTSAAPSAGDDAYVMFTSGSTGVPKAVYAPHRAVTRLVCGVEYVRLDAETRVLQLAPLSFDASTLEIWGPLLNGGTVVVHPQDLPALVDLGHTMARHGVTTAWLTASLFNRVIDTAPEILRPLRQVLTGGEALSVPHVVRALAALPETTIVNGYGPTETTTFATTLTIPRTYDPSSVRVPIGTPIPHTQVYVLDAHRDLQPIGVAGEIHIGGDGLGRLADAELEAAAFVPDPFSVGAAARLYRTGDRGRLLADGTFEFIERLDRQVKIHGHRIEPGEIEAVLGRHPDVREVAVLATTDAAGERRLVAYVVLAAATAPAAAASDVRAFAARRLPDYMVPASIVLVPALPLSMTGKVDARALAHLGAAPSAHRSPPVAPRTPLEAIVAGIWTPVLRVESPGVEDNFFEAGGHSLLALRLIHELNLALGLELPVRLIFEDPTIAGIARAIEGELAKQFGREKRYEPLVPLKPGGDRLPFFLVPGGGGGEAELIIYAGLARYLDPHQPFFGLRARGVDELVDPHESVEAMAAEYVREIRRVQPAGPYVIGGSCVGGIVALEMAQQLRRARQEVRALILIDSTMPRWSRFIRDQWDVWSHRPRPGAEAAHGGGALAVARHWWQWLVTPIAQQRAARRRVRIRWMYLARLIAYEPMPYEGPMILLRAMNRGVEDPARRWRAIAAGPFEVHDIPGDHFSHLRNHARETAGRLDACLERANAQTWPLHA